LGNPQGWGFGNLIDPNSNDDQDGFINTPEVEDELTTLKAAAQYLFDDGMISSVEVGLNYSDRRKEREDTGVFLTLPGAIDALGNVIPGYRLPVPEDYRLPNVSLDFIGFGDQIAFDSFRFWQDGNYLEFDSAITDPGRAQNTWVVEEKATTAYVKANIDTDIGDIPVRGNVGLQVVQLDQSSTGSSSRRQADQTLVIQPTSGGDKYTEVLPSINLIAEVADGQMLRLGVARTMSRSRMDRMNASSGDLGYSEQTNVWSGSVANPQLRPVMADQFDFTYENYFHEEGYFAAAYFYKKLSNWQQQAGRIVDTSDLTPPPGQPVADFGVLNSWRNLGDGHVSGVELSLSVSGAMFSDALDGFGGIVSATFLDSELKYSIDVPVAVGSDEIQSIEFDDPVPGLSEEVYNATVYYEKQGFQARVSWRSRSDFLGEVAGLSLVRQPVNVQGSDLLDAQISYDFSESGIEALDGLTLTLQAQNLTDEEFVTEHSANDDTSLDIRDVQRFGRNYLFGLSYKF
jgi:iron complex outermembrane receptor protein